MIDDCQLSFPCLLVCSRFTKLLLMAIAQIFKQFGAWFPSAHQKIKAQADELGDKLKGIELDPIPPTNLLRLKQAVAELKTPLPHQELLRAQLSKAINSWSEGAECDNAMVVLASPVEAISTVFWDTLSSSEPIEGLTRQWLPWSERAKNYTIISQLEESILQPSQGERSLVVIPDLSWCFLRCVDGLQGIERLGDAIFSDRSRFWLIGCNHWTWLYLDRVCQLGNLVGVKTSIPPLSAIELKEWLTPVWETVDIQWREKSEGEEEEPQENWCCSEEKRYFEQLEDVSEGNRAIAAEAWLNSLGISPPPEEEEEEEGENQTRENPDQPWLVDRPSIPELPSLTKSDRFLLFSLILHGSISLPNLCLTLGEGESATQTQVQKLIRDGLIIRRPGNSGAAPRFAINGIYYPRLKRDLDNNKFLVGGEYKC
ncbi:MULTISPECIES: MarR family transcriptional regulator [Oscillatoriales]|uniref:Uncharacterized protein n=3 Tax=Limnospira TaxID=2596745 RepID=B5W923_LIMMA|nr:MULTISPECIES: MarR family transcriptional regulator [Oscillatoriales]EKD09581.1 hypothetical protein SPLC1_S170300 [Arthrospira platensis C1]MBD2667552.1 MarR family transcriptional regulator [Arthrospira platensis FACHB-439]MBD2709695.1 MarR family transcriptional regulator [Arthrospira platensis FACHB-835]MDC0839683.1 MarR family transcriptional regulator [Limnoraphis robusta]MDY7052376.1 MarR family transcriptional regulator [Limnospira fusiformis LS22]